MRNQLLNFARIRPESSHFVCSQAALKVLSCDSSVIFDYILSSIEFFACRMPTWSNVTSHGYFKTQLVHAMSLHTATDECKYLDLTRAPIFESVYSVPCNWLPESGLSALGTFLSCDHQQTGYNFSDFPFPATQRYLDSASASHLRDLRSAPMFQVSTRFRVHSGSFQSQHDARGIFIYKSIQSKRSTNKLQQPLRNCDTVLYI